MSNPFRSWPLLLIVSLVVPVGSARAEDTWVDPYPGIRSLKRATPGRLFHVITVSLSHPDLAVRATGPEERGRTTVAYAKLAEAAVAISGDAFSAPGFLPRGPAVGDGKAWPRTDPLPTDRAFIACDRTCKIGTTSSGKALGPEWKNVVGGEGSLLIRDGVVRPADEDTRCGNACLADLPPNR